MVTITRHVSINIFQLEHFLVVKFAMGYEENMSILVIAKSQKVFKRVEKIGLGTFNTNPNILLESMQKLTVLRGSYTSCQKFSMFSALSQNNQ